jgi:hypothetical protein
MSFEECVGGTYRFGKHLVQLVLPNHAGTAGPLHDSVFQSNQRIAVAVQEGSKRCRHLCLELFVSGDIALHEISNAQTVSQLASNFLTKTSTHALGSMLQESKPNQAGPVKFNTCTQPASGHGSLARALF